MTLVVARQGSEGRIRVIADMKITHPWEIKRGYPHAGLKNIVLDNGLLVAYAGNVELAVHTIRESSHLRGEQLVTALSKSSQAAGPDNQAVEYLIADVERGLRRIRDGGAEPPTRATWIGHEDAFAVYQQVYHNMPRPWLLEMATQDDQLAELYPDTPDTEAFLRMDGAISAISQTKYMPPSMPGSSDPIPALDSIGEVFVSACSKDGFHYEQQVMLVTGVDTIVSGTELQPIQMGTVADGAFSYALLTPSAPGIGLIGLYFAFGRCGILYHPLSHTAPLIYSGTSYEEFIAAVSEDHGVTIEGPNTG